MQQVTVHNKQLSTAGEATPIILHFSLYLPTAEMTLDLEVKEVEVKGLTSLASVTETPGDAQGRISVYTPRYGDPQSP